ncbi:MAG: filamentous hemagglutinin N-terminal domain-containing protein, partial [Burkholderiaceae bacterium]
MKNTVAKRRTIPGAVGARPPLRPLRLTLLMATAFGSSQHGTALANPVGPQVSSGAASFSQQGATLEVKNSPGAIINWLSFSIAPGQTTNFIQQSISSTVLNRVTGVAPSSILGNLTSNGKVFLINPNGVVFGQGSVVNAAGLVVSTLNLSDADFQAGNLRFVGNSASGNLEISGVIRSSSGDIYLIAPNVQNAGSISAPNGNVILAAGQTVDILGPGLDNIRFEVQNRGNQAINLGQLQGDAVGFFAGSIQQAGTVNATGIAMNGGQVVLSALGDINLSSGSTTRADGVASGGAVQIQSQTGNVQVAPAAVVSASGQTGGSIILQASQGTDLIFGELLASGTAVQGAPGSAQGGVIEALGQTVAVQGGAVLDASGSTGGGAVYVGGGRRGANTAIQDATNTSVARGAVVSADATQKGNGGTVVVFANDAANVQGTLNARGGTQGGNGGYVETSAHRDLFVSDVPNAGNRAPGKAGLWFIDPGDVTIGAANGT